MKLNIVFSRKIRNFNCFSLVLCKTQDHFEEKLDRTYLFSIYLLATSKFYWRCVTLIGEIQLFNIEND